MYPVFKSAIIAFLRVLIFRFEMKNSLIESKKAIMQSITQMYLKNEYLPINYGKKYRVRDFVLLNSTICNICSFESRVRKVCLLSYSINNLCVEVEFVSSMIVIIYKPVVREPVFIVFFCIFSVFWVATNLPLVSKIVTSVGKQLDVFSM